MTTHCEGFSNDWNPPITRKFPTGSQYLRITIIPGVIKEIGKYKGWYSIWICIVLTLYMCPWKCLCSWSRPVFWSLCLAAGSWWGIPSAVLSDGKSCWNYQPSLETATWRTDPETRPNSLHYGRADTINIKLLNPMTIHYPNNPKCTMSKSICYILRASRGLRIPLFTLLRVQ